MNEAVKDGMMKHGSLHTTSPVQKPIARLEGIVDLIGTDIVVDLPQSKTNHGHFIAIIQLDRRRGLRRSPHGAV